MPDSGTPERDHLRGQHGLLPQPACRLCHEGEGNLALEVAYEEMFSSGYLDPLDEGGISRRSFRAGWYARRLWELKLITGNTPPPSTEHSTP